MDYQGVIRSTLSVLSATVVGPGRSGKKKLLITEVTKSQSRTAGALLAIGAARILCGAFGRLPPSPCQGLQSVVDLLAALPPEA